MKGTIFTAVLICSAILAACSPAAPREAMASTQSPSPSPAEEPADETSEEAYHIANALRTSWWNWDTNMYMILAELWTGPMKQ